MKDKINLSINRGKSYFHILHNGKIIAKIKVSESNRTKNVSLEMSSDKSETVFKIERLAIDESYQLDDNRFNKEEYNR
jgi:hypothetical protein